MTAPDSGLVSRRLPLTASVLIGLALVGAACGGGSPKAGVASVGPTTTVVPSTASATGGAAVAGGSAPGGALVQYARCMRAHRVPNFRHPNPTTGAMNTPAGIDRTSPVVLAALRARAALGRAAGLGPLTPDNEGEAP